ncbi:MAG TPA: hypothetical protein PK400_11895, partial [Phycisphaerales bacterium]|nr:hypothetical protein [Phycisphaerales bacterium]
SATWTEAASAFGPRWNEFGELDAYALVASGLLRFEVAIGLNLVTQLVLLNAAGIAGGLGRP